jgi:N-methylhydantoinase A
VTRNAVGSADHAPEGATRTVYFERGGGSLSARVLRADDLSPGDSIVGPAVIDMPTTGIVVPPDTRVTRADGGDFIMTFEG